MATQRQREAAKQNVNKAQATAKQKQTLKHMPKQTRHDLGVEANKVKKGEKTRQEYQQEAARLGIEGRSKMGKDELRQAVKQRR
jgi:hypothetical protein